MNHFASRLLCVVCAFISLMAFSERAEAAVRPYSASGTAQFTSPTDFIGVGYATHLGRYVEAGSVAFSPTSNPAVLHVDGAIIYTAANGEELHAVVTGELNGVTGAITATVSYVGGTGRFAAASGSATLAGQLGAGGTISVTVSGTIDF
jgi:hypothetical protein